MWHCSKTDKDLLKIYILLDHKIDCIACILLKFYINTFMSEVLVKCSSLGFLWWFTSLGVGYSAQYHLSLAYIKESIIMLNLEYIIHYSS